MVNGFLFAELCFLFFFGVIGISSDMADYLNSPSNNQGKFKYPYGIRSHHELSELELWLTAFRLDPPKEVGGVGKPYYFWKIVDLLWGENSRVPKENKLFKHPWAERMIELACEHKYLGVHGAGSSGKTLIFAAWGIVNWLSDPMNTLVLATSTSLKDARKRIWGAITSLFQLIPDHELIGRLVDSVGMIRSVAPDGTANDDRCGIALIPGEKRKEKDAIGKIIGMKNKKVFMLCDELPELSEALISAAQSNLALNPFFQMVGLGNFNSIYDPLGVFVTPKNGWGSVKVDDEEWETEHGYCLHLDGMKSPNVLLDQDVYPRIYNKKNLKEHQARYGANSALFWRMCRSFPCPEGESNCIYSEADFIKGYSTGKADWLEIPVSVCAADPAFTNEGDNFSVCHGRFGKSANGLPTLEIQEMLTLREDMDLTIKGEARDLQTARQLSEGCRARNVGAKHLGIDCSGPGGLAFGSILSIYWGNNYLPIKFGEVASDLPISMNDPRRGHEAFVNLSSELWWMGRELVRAGQIKNLPAEVAKQLKARHYESVKLGDFLKIKIEPKRDMKKRIGESPDCFVAGTMVLTDSGEVPIECIQIGDMVRTPFGCSPVIVVHESQTSETSKIEMSNGRALEGKGKHRVFTNDSGWVRMDALVLDNSIESDTMLPLWNFLNSLFTKVGNTGFKALADTIKTKTGAASRRDFFTESSGLSAMGLFLKVCACITKTVTGRITGLGTWNCSPTQITPSITRRFFSEILNIVRETGEILMWPLSPLLNGEGNGLRPQRAGSGTSGLESLRGLIRNDPNASASPVEKCLKLGRNSQNTALQGASQSIRKNRPEPIKGNALSAAMCLLLTGIGRRRVVLKNVAAISYPEPIKVYNLTLLEDNAYYANGVLVENCGDAFLMLVHLCRVVFGFSPGTINSPGSIANRRSPNDEWMNKVRNAHSVYENQFAS